MFTGIVEGRGEIVKIDRAERDAVLWLRSPVLNDCEIGASVSIDGSCLTVTDRDGDVCRFNAVAETIERTTIGERKVGDAVNLERPLRAGAELGGHVVQGHVDGVGTVESLYPDGDSVRVRIAVPRDLAKYLVEKGSVAVDGVSLTVTAALDAAFEVSLVPHTLEVTKSFELGRNVNIEVDVLAKYVERLLDRRDSGPT